MSKVGQPSAGYDRIALRTQPSAWPVVTEGRAWYTEPTLAVPQEVEIMDLDLLSVLVGAAAAIVGGIIGGWVQGWAWYYFERKRAAEEKRERDTENVLNWEILHCPSLRRADLQGAILHKVDLYPVKKDGHGNLIPADLSHSNLQKAILTEANLGKALLMNADLRCANLRDADLTEANLTDADLRGANLAGANLGLGDRALTADLTGALYNDYTIPPEGGFSLLDKLGAKRVELPPLPPPRPLHLYRPPPRE
jgi:hypothetical protein